MTLSAEEDIPAIAMTSLPSFYSADDRSNMTGTGNGSSNLEHQVFGHGRQSLLGWYISTPGAAVAMIPLGLLTATVNAVVCLALVAERALQTTLYTYLASLAACDVIGAVIVTPLAAAALYYGMFFSFSRF
jgi:hypothetical protein